jgi:hypothetical protein
VARAGSLIVQLAVDLAKFRSDMGSAAAISNTRLREIQRSAQTTVNQMTKVGATIRNAFGVVGIGVGLSSIIGSFKQAAAAAIEYGDEVQKAALKTGLSSSQFAQLANAAKLADVEMESLSKSLRMMQVAVSKFDSGEKGPAETFRALGIAVRDLKGLRADEQLELIADQIARLGSAEDKARLGVEVFGKSWDGIAPFLLQGADGIRRLRDEVDKLGPALTDNQLAKLADADDAIKKLKLSWSNFARTMTGEVSPSIINVLDQLTALSRIDFSKVFKEMGKGGPLFGGLEFYKQIKSVGKPPIKPEGSWGQPVGGTSFGKPVTRSLLPAPPGPTAEAAGGGRKAADSGISEITVYAKQIYDRAAILRDASAELNADLLADSASTKNELVNNYRDWAGAGTEMLKQLATDSEKSFSAMSVFAEQAGRNMQDALAQFLFDPFKDGLNGMLAGFVDTIRSMVAQLAAQELLKAFFTWGSGLGGGIGSFSSSVLSGLTGKASGGPVSAGGAYLVGERGPEMFVPRSSGTIIPNGVGGSVVVNYSIDARGADADRIMAILPPLLKQTEERTVARVIDLQRRGRFA